MLYIQREIVQVRVNSCEDFSESETALDKMSLNWECMLSLRRLHLDLGFPKGQRLKVNTEVRRSLVSEICEFIYSCE